MKATRSGGKHSFVSGLSVGSLVSNIEREGRHSSYPFKKNMVKVGLTIFIKTEASELEFVQQS